ncbi:MAG: anthranilate synthase component I family protein [Saprospiraceae bacterium]|nr:anthranilate synthase component I family protein [Saprospiraceae bacterium]
MKIYARYQEISGDTHTPVSLYLQLRDKYAQPALLESTDYHASQNSLSFIGLDPLITCKVENNSLQIYSKNAEWLRLKLRSKALAPALQSFIDDIEIEFDISPLKQFSGFFGYTAFDAIPLAEDISFKSKPGIEIPPVLYFFYKSLIVFNHFNDTIYLLTHDFTEDDAADSMERLQSNIQSRQLPGHAFYASGNEQTSESESRYLEMVDIAQKHIKRGDVFQLVLSRAFNMSFAGDEFEVYRKLRQVNPSPYLFYFDFGDFKIFGSSPEAQLVIQHGIAEIHPIAGTFPRSGDDSADILRAEALKQDAKESAEHFMLVDLARNDLYRHCTEVKVETLKEVQFFSHLIHLVSKVTGKLQPDTIPFQVMLDTFPAGTLSGAPKYRALQLIDELESSSRAFYGGAIGYMGLDGSINHAIMIRTLLSKDNVLHFRAGAGIVDASIPQKELEEVSVKLNALRKAISLASVSSKSHFIPSKSNTLV